jgi:hypothetical protein
MAKMQEAARELETRLLSIDLWPLSRDHPDLSSIPTDQQTTGDRGPTDRVP